ncbi:hypothetical protein F4225_02610, partial [Candidatus Poribacteria bacterium]|nr:hypothetical protein [Candidatus Poribacteria bacterium]
MRPMIKIIILIIITLGFGAIFIILSSRNDIYDVESFESSEFPDDNTTNIEAADNNKPSILKDTIKRLNEFEHLDRLYRSPNLKSISPIIPEEHAESIYRNSQMLYACSKRIEHLYRYRHDASKDAYDLILTLYEIAESKNKVRFNILFGKPLYISERKFYAIIDVCELDASDVIANTANFVFEKVKQGDWDHSSLSKNKKYVQKSMNDQRQKMKTISG